MYSRVFKRILDIVFSFICLLLFMIVLIFVAPLIWLEDKGPIFYNAKRLGKNGKIFKMYKFRTMKVNSPDLRNSDGSTFNSDDDPRLTTIGKILRKTSIDELPQFINVLIGNMSFVGPRPDLPEHINEYSEEEKKKLKVLPGITGYNQAYFRNSIEWHDRLKNDVYYVEHISFFLDIKIIFKTILSVLKKDGIFVNSDKYDLVSLNWDTEYFGVKSGKIVLKDTINENNLKNIRKQIKQFEFITITNLNNNNENNKLISKLDAFLTDVNVQFKKEINIDSKLDIDKHVKIENNCKENEQMLDIAKNAYKYSRFINDNKLDKTKSKLLYYNWLKNSFNKKDKYIAYYLENKKYLGYCLFHLEDDNTCVIELIATDNNVHGKGIGSKLLKSVEAFCIDRKILKIQVGTQLDNIVAQNFYVKNGFKINSYNSTYHLWR